MTALAARASASRLDRMLLMLSARLEALAVRRMQQRAHAASARPRPALSDARAVPTGTEAAAVHMSLLPR